MSDLFEFAFPNGYDEQKTAPLFEQKMNEMFDRQMKNSFDFSFTLPHPEDDIYEPIHMNLDSPDGNQACEPPKEEKTQVLEYPLGRSISYFDSDRDQNTMPYAISDESFVAEFADTHLWSCEYQRNNRNGGMKNIRCFPYCGTKHFSSGFCGESLLVTVKTNSTANRVYAYAEIGLSYAQGKDVVKVGQVLTREVIMDKVRTSEKPFRSWWDGDLRETKETFNKQTSKTERAFAFEFNRSKRGWHYGWVANKYISNLKHQVRAYIFVPTKEGDLKCVGVASSPDFTLFSRKPKRETNGANAKSKSNGTKPKQSRKRPTPKSGRNVMKPTSYLTNDDRDILKRARLDIKKHNCDPKQIDLAAMYESLDSNLKGDVLRVFHKILNLPSDAYRKSISTLSGDPEENKALLAFAKFLISDEEDITAVVQEKISNMNPFEEESKGLNSPKSEQVFSAAKDSFNKFLAPYKVDVNAFATQKNAKEIVQQLETNESKCKVTKGEVPKQVPDLNNDIFLSTFEGTWVRNKESLDKWEELYTCMDLPYALKKCYLAMMGKQTINVVEGTNSILMRYNRKLFSNGKIRYTFDGKVHPWDMTTPLMVNHEVGHSSWIENSEIKIEHHYENQKIRRSFRVNGDKLEGHAILFTKSAGVGNCVEWTQEFELKETATKLYTK